MYHVLYVSSATESFSDEKLGLLLEKSRKTNSRLGVTGILLHKDNNFIQVLEGEEDAVMAVYYKIMLDSRHHKVMTLIKEETHSREFADWSMGFKNLNDPAIRDLPGYSDFMNLSFAPEELNSNMSRCKRLLSLFKQDAAV